MGNLLQLHKISKDNYSEAAKGLWKSFSTHISYLPKKGKKIVDLAFTQMVISHSDQRRKSGDYYIIHPVDAAITLCKMGLDQHTIAACLLHDVPEDTSTSLKDLIRDFPPEVVFLVEGVTKLSSVKYQGEDRYAENLRRMFIAMSKDLRVILIKLADRLHNLRTLTHVKPEKRYRIALESVEIYASIAERLGISYIRGEIEDAAFPYLYPKEYKKFVSTLDLAIQKRAKVASELKKKVEKILKNEGIPFEKVSGRAKRYYSIFRKMKNQNKSLSQIQDLVALRVVTFNEDQCYSILSLLYKYFEPIPERLKDYISRPKENGYRSVHTTVRDKHINVTFEFQIKTKEMYEYAEYGVASHWAYKEGVDYNPNANLKSQNLKWIDHLLNLGREKISQEEYLRQVKLNLFTDSIFVLTPKNDPIELPAGSTCLDFAYKIHGEIGNHTILTRVNGKTQKLGKTLRNGDIVEIVTDKKQKPKQEWLKWVKTSSAIKNIKHELRKSKG